MDYQLAQSLEPFWLRNKLISNYWCSFSYRQSLRDSIQFTLKATKSVALATRTDGGLHLTLSNRERTHADRDVARVENNRDLQQLRPGEARRRDSLSPALSSTFSPGRMLERLRRCSHDGSPLQRPSTTLVHGNRIHTKPARKRGAQLARSGASADRRPAGARYRSSSFGSGDGNNGAALFCYRLQRRQPCGLRR